MFGQEKQHIPEGVTTVAAYWREGCLLRGSMSNRKRLADGVDKGKARRWGAAKRLILLF